MWAAAMNQRDGLLVMWNEACRTGMAHTAYGILLDLFSLWDALDDDPEAPISACQQAAFREDLMRVLGDEDGADLRYWRQLWEGDRAEFRRRALKHIEGRLSEW
jgi:hypothetical protein